MINLDQITCGVLRDRANLTPSILAKFDDGLSHWLCLIDLFDHAVFPTKVLISNNFENAKNEIFNEVHVSITLAYHPKFRAAAILTRSCIELSCYALYFVDHPADCLLWSDNVHDLSFGAICAKIFAPDYL